MEIINNTINQDGNARYERKFEIEGYSINEIQEYIRLHPAHFKTIYSSRYVNNIYLDTPLFKNYHTSTNGISIREKIRIRWYGSLFGKVKKPNLEIKGKKSFISYKESFLLNSFIFDKGIGAKEIKNIIDKSEINKNRKYYLTYLKPMMINRYRRQYWLSGNRKFRLTIDDKMKFINFFKINNQFLSSVKDDYNVVVEIKYGLKEDAHLPEITNHFPFRLNKKSKYISGINLVRYGKCDI